LPRIVRRAGKKLYEDLANPSCVVCHGEDGDGNGQLASQFDPPPRNFACAATVDGIPDGQLHWIIKNGSPGTAMPSFDYLSDEEIWQLVIYLRSLTGHD
jgi:mono/diheme cytochrome c family protein